MKWIKTTAASALCLTVAALAAGQDWHRGKGRLEGSVTNSKGEPIAGAVVALRLEGNGGPDLKTDKKGRWSILGINAGNWEVDISAPGYQPRKLSVSVSEVRRAQPITLQLEPEVQQQPAQQEVPITVGGKAISKEAAEALEKGNAASQAKNYAEAQANYLKVLPELPDNISLLSNLALVYYFDNKPDEALKYARQTVEKDPGNQPAWLIISELELQKGNLEAGQQALAKVPDERITSPTPYLNVGILFYNKKRAVEAEEYFSKAIAKKPDLAEAYYYRGLARYQLKRTAEAKADLEKSIELDPSGKDAETAKEILKSMK
ncbi:MAG TPA: tetratricopeptide repeat protein [Thermoanaerobaculia bacterium]|nr:tetratricopeptide repeat protein [Thermoanaerobaculia bacterium]